VVDTHENAGISQKRKKFVAEKWLETIEG